jgi:hypothetical protein
MSELAQIAEAVVGEGLQHPPGVVVGFAFSGHGLTARGKKQTRAYSEACGDQDLRLFVRARFQPCRKSGSIGSALAAGVCSFRFATLSINRNATIPVFFAPSLAGPLKPRSHDD